VIADACFSPIFSRLFTIRILQRCAAISATAELLYNLSVATCLKDVAAEVLRQQSGATIMKEAEVTLELHTNTAPMTQFGKKY